MNILKFLAAAIATAFLFFCILIGVSLALACLVFAVIEPWSWRIVGAEIVLLIVLGFVLKSIKWTWEKTIELMPES